MLDPNVARRRRLKPSGTRDFEMTFSGLPKVLLESIHSEQDVTVLRGRVDRLKGLREGVWLRVMPGRYIGAELEVSDSGTGSVSLKVVNDPRAANLALGKEYTVFGDHWQAPLVEAIGSVSTVWRQFEFRPTDAVYFRQGTAVGWQELGVELPKGAIKIGVKTGGWDHEHCSLCGGYIDAESPTGYAADDGLFLCATCYGKYAARRDVSFVLGA